MNIQPGDLVSIMPSARHIVRNERIASSAVVMSLIDGDWCRVFMCWPDQTRIVDFPKHFLKKINKL